MNKTDTLYIANLKSILAANAETAYAVRMKKYMRNRFGFYGVKSPVRKELFRQFIKENGWPGADDLEAICRELYIQPEREFHYFAMEMAERNIKKFNESAVKLFEFMIVTGSWWDTVDFIAANILGRYFRIYPELITL